MNLRIFPLTALGLALSSLAASAQSPVLYTTFGSNYSYAYTVESRKVAEADFVAMPFVPQVTATLNQVIVPVYNLAKPDEIRFTLASDSNGVPGAALESWLLTNLVFGALTTNASVHYPTLTNGSQYWLVASVDNPSTQSYWWLGPLDGSIPAENVESHDQGATWTETTDTDCAFEIDALNPMIASFTSTPTNVLFSALNGLAGHRYVLISSASLAATPPSWTPLATNQVTTNGPFTLSANLPFDSNTAALFYTIKMR